jgi:GNAT superfamily N-acetyltransferase
MCDRPRGPPARRSVSLGQMSELTIREMERGEEFEGWFEELVGQQDTATGSNLRYDHHLLVLTNEVGDWVGGVRYYLRGGIAHLLEFAVIQHEEHLGYGLRLLESFENKAAEGGAQLLEFWTNDLESAAIYADLGWQEVVRRPRYVGGDEWVLMEKALPGRDG